MTTKTEILDSMIAAMRQGRLGRDQCFHETFQFDENCEIIACCLSGAMLIGFDLHREERLAGEYEIADRLGYGPDTAERKLIQDIFFKAITLNDQYEVSFDDAESRLRFEFGDFIPPTKQSS